MKSALLLALFLTSAGAHAAEPMSHYEGICEASAAVPLDAQHFAVAEDEGIPIYVISTNEVNKDPISSGVFKRMTSQTGGRSYFAKTWQKQVEAFESIREDLGNSYPITYYPQANQNEGFRKLSVDVTTDIGKKYRIQCRPGYRPRSGF